MSPDNKAKSPRVGLLPEHLIFIGGLVLVALFLEAPRLLDWVGPIAAFVILGLLLVPGAIFMLKAKRGTFQFRVAQANLSFIFGLFLVFLFFWLVSMVPRNQPILLLVPIAVLIPGLVFGLAGAMLRLFLMAEGTGTWLLRHRGQIMPRLTHKNFHRVLNFGYIVAGVGVYAIGVVPVGVSPYVPWMIFVTGLLIIITALTLDHEFASKSNR